MHDDRLNLLLSALSRLTISVELEPTLATLLHSLGELIDFDAAGIFALESDGRLVRARATTGFPADFSMPAEQGVVGAVLRSGQAQVVADAANDPSYVPARKTTASQLTVPLTSPRGTFGAISLESDHPGAFGHDDLLLMIAFAQQATVAIERALLHEQLIARSRLDREIEIAREILAGLTPASPLTLPGFTVAGRSLTAETVGGDAFDFISYPDAQVGLSICDAKGKGVPAALLSVAHHAMLRSLVGLELRLRATFQRMSTLLASSVPPSEFITSFYGIVDIAERRLVYANAGHLPPLLVRADGAIESLETTGPALGFPGVVAPLREAYAAFGPGDGLVLFTDGVTEVGPTPDEFFDVDGLKETVRRLWREDVSRICDGVLDEVIRRADGRPPDDATVVAARFE